MNRRTFTSAALAAAVAVTLAACGSSTTEPGSASSPSASASPTSAAVVSATDPWIKAVDSGMTAAFVVLDNVSSDEQVLVKAVTSAASMVELHEMAMVDGQMVMQQKDGGIAVPAGGEATLEPGGDHIMLMNVTAPIKPGDVVPITLTFASGEILEITAVAKEFEGGAEPYHSSSASPSMSGT